MVTRLLLGSFLSYGLIIVALISTRRTSSKAVLYSVGLLFVTTAIAALNLRYGIIEQKFASEFAYERFAGVESVRPNQTFAVQALINTPAFLVAGGWEAAIGTNAALSAGFFAYIYDPETKAHRYFLGPAVINFALFSLRDPVIGLILGFLVIAFGAEFKKDKLVAPLAIAAVAMFWTRPENLLIILALVGVLALRYAKTPASRIAVVGGGLVSAAFAFRFAPALLGVQGSVSLTGLPSFLAEFSESRGTRTTSTGVGGGSDILGGALQRMPIPIRYPIQLITFFLLPLPHEIRSITLLLSAMDSVFFAIGSRQLFKKGSKPARLLFVLYVLVAAFFSSNYGNVFRIRYPLYFVIGAGLLAAKNQAGEETDAIEETEVAEDIPELSNQ